MGRKDIGDLRFDDYELGFYDEMFVRRGEPRAIARRLMASIEALPDGELLNRHKAAERELLQMGITFNVYGSTRAWRKSSPSTSCRGLSARRNGPELSGDSNSAFRRLTRPHPAKNRA